MKIHVFLFSAAAIASAVNGFTGRTGLATQRMQVSYNIQERRLFRAKQAERLSNRHSPTIHQLKVAVRSRNRPLSQLSDTSSPMIDSSLSTYQQHKTTAVYALILLSVLSFVADNIMRLPSLRTLYLYHWNWHWWQLFTSIFCHGDKAHLSGNIFLMLLFGRSVEDELGPLGLMFSYLFCGVVANFVSLVVLPSNTVSFGASGAVFGLFSVSIFSRLSWRDIADWRKLVEVGVLGQFVVNRFLDEVKTAATGGVAGVNHVAHLSGAGAGVVFIFILRKLIKKLESQVQDKKFS